MLAEKRLGSATEVESLLIEPDAKLVGRVATVTDELVEREAKLEGAVVERETDVTNELAQHGAKLICLSAALAPQPAISLAALAPQHVGCRSAVFKTTLVDSNTESYTGNPVRQGG